MVFKIFGVLVPKTKVVPAMKGLNARGGGSLCTITLDANVHAARSAPKSETAADVTN